ncbi:hypothetical protein I553_7601 [Mycobacterium xenopi 4042]|uniref:Uncharacterized protein n=1 Tax=Mycobacterium xenopi 4042 TaxID=1299334 RepID=X8APY2_MYCXE|nr:hypothetical protein I553_7601 [Mycobacterium xenopi 4042]
MKSLAFCGSSVVGTPEFLVNTGVTGRSAPVRSPIRSVMRQLLPQP